MDYIDCISHWNEENNNILTDLQIKDLSSSFEAHIDWMSTIYDNCYWWTDYEPKIYEHKHNTILSETKDKYEDKIRELEEKIRDLKWE